MRLREVRVIRLLFHYSHHPAAFLTYHSPFWRTLTHSHVLVRPQSIISSRKDPYPLLERLNDSLWDISWSTSRVRCTLEMQFNVQVFSSKDSYFTQSLFLVLKKLDPLDWIHHAANLTKWPPFRSALYSHRKFHIFLLDKKRYSLFCTGVLYFRVSAIAYA